jgi:hypothetical protein
MTPDDSRQRQRDVPQSESSVVHARDCQDATLVSKQAPQQISRDQPDRMIGGTLPADDFGRGSSHFLGAQGPQTCSNRR